MSDIFISYSKEDRDQTRKLAKALEEHGWSVWWDRIIPAGRSFAEVIGEALDNAKCILVLWSSNSVNSDWVQEEADKGRKKGILIPALIERVEPPLGFGRIQAADLVEWDGNKANQAFVRLVADIENFIAPPTTKEKKPTQAQEQKPEPQPDTDSPDQAKVDDRKTIQKQTKKADKRPKTKTGWQKNKVAIIWLCSATAFVFLSLLFFQYNNIRLFGMSSEGPGLLLGSLMAMGSGIFLAYRRKNKLEGGEIAIYWLGCAAAFIILSLVFFAEDNIRWFDMSRAETGSFFGSLVSFGSGIYLAFKRRDKLTGVEKAIYWLGCAAAFIILSLVLA
jgi:cell division protein FtsL